jgi:hypothetical protein
MADTPQATQDPLAESAQVEAGQVDPALVGRDPTERALGFGAQGGPLDQALQRHHQQRVAQAKMYRGNLASAVSKLAAGETYDQSLGRTRPLTQDEIGDLTAQREEAQKNYDKIIGVNPQSKEALGKAHGIIDFILQRKQAQRQGGMSTPPTPQYGSTVGEGGVSLTPPPGSTPTVMDNGVTMAPPPPVRQQPSALEQSVAAPLQRHQMGISQGLENTQRAWQQGIDLRTKEAEKMWGSDYANNPTAQRYIATATFPPFMGLQKSNLVDPDTEEPVSFDRLSGTYATADGREVKNPVPAQKPQMAEVVMPNGDHAIAYEKYGKLTDQSGNPLPEGTKKFYSQMADTQTATHTFKTVQQPDGSTALVPVTTTGERHRGGTPTGAGRAGGATPPPLPGASAAPEAHTHAATGGVGVSKPASAAKSSPQANAAAALNLPPGSRIVGGKVPPGVAKAYETYNGSVSRYKIMQEALPKALKGDQQAMINLLYNHIGMTTGLQKGGRITQPIIDEAQNSAPVVATLLKRIGVGNEFEMSPTLLRGVVIDPQTMHNMIGLAEDRTNQDYSAWQREIGSAKTGYGMSTPPPATSPDIGAASKPGGFVKF